MPSRILSETLLHQGFVNVSRLTARTKDGEVTREVEHHGAAAAVLAYDPDRKVAAVAKVFRFGALKGGGDPVLLEACAGMIDEGEQPEEAARREALEELGLELRELEAVGAFWSTPGVSSERIHLFLARFIPSDRKAEGGGKAEEQEGLEPVEQPLSELWDGLLTGAVADLKTAALLQALRIRRPELFE